MNLSLIFAIAAGFAGGLLFRWINVPGGAIVGSMLGAGVYSAMQTEGVEVPKNVSLLAQLTVGALVGTSANRELFSSGLEALGWGLIGAVVYMIVGIVLAFISWKLGYLELDTAIFGFSPGGFTGMAMIAQGEGANASQVVLMHFTRVFLLFFIVPTVVRLMVGWFG
ncbi:MAG: AbrB family transcriptional regulator [Chloroflexota bacterium]